jgi:AcrR family transcriptional regulator
LIERLSTKELLAKSLKELAQTKPIDKITIKDITDNCGLSKRTFYHNFQDKAELVLFEYSLNLSKVFNAESKDLSWLELMHRAIMVIVNDYDYYKNAFHVFDSSSYPISGMKSTSSSVFEDFIKLKTGIKELTEEEKIALKYTPLATGLMALNGLKTVCRLVLKNLPSIM